MKSIYFVLIAICLSACSGLRTLPDGEKLYTGAKVIVVSNEKLRDKGEIKNNVEAVLRPAPNKKFLGNRPKVWIYNITNDKKGKGFKHWLKTKVGEPPVLMSSVKPDITKGLIDAALFNRGIFNSLTESKTEEKEKRGKVIYTVHAHNPYTIKIVNFPSGMDSVSQAITATKDKTILKPGRDYNLEGLRNERKRIDESLKNAGYFYFSADYILFKADTSVADKNVSLTLTLKENIPLENLLVYRINNVSVVNDFMLAENDTMQKDTLTLDGVLFIGNRNIRPKVILRSVFLKKGEVYSRRNHNITLSRLMGMGTFKFVRVNFASTDTLHPGYLNAEIQLTPSPRKSIQLELQTISKSNNFLGPALNVAYQNRNSLRGAELLKVNLKGSLETQLTGKEKNVFSYEIGPQVELIIPRIMAPFRLRQPRSIYIPKTKISGSFDYLRRVNFYDLNSLQFQFGYNWKENIKIEHVLNPVSMNYFTVRNKSDEFQNLLLENPFFKRSFEDQFIAGINYAFTFDEQVIPLQKSMFYLHFTTDFAGNTITAYNRIFNGKDANPDRPLTIAGIPYSQFMRFTVDLRNYFNFSQKQKLVVRLYTGMGYPYGNSSTLPYVKQFFSGGPNSVRAFRINSLGPGITPPNKISNAILRNGGDLKLEGNTEYRFDIYKIVKGAFFVDAGNMWIQKKDTQNIYAGFKRSELISQLAAGSGFGLRFDASFFVLRFDLAFPIRKPWLEPSQRWVLNNISAGSSAWRRENLVLNVAIGYPF
ncbi:MAG: BamA/TamA family outer membrane protein [Bacteroidota bacterium]